MSGSHDSERSRSDTPAKRAPAQRRAPSARGPADGGFLGGVADAASEMYQMGTHPAETWEGVKWAASNPDEAIANALRSCDRRSVGNCGGYVVAGLLGGKGSSSVVRGGLRTSGGDARYKKGSKVTEESGLDWALMSAEQRAGRVIEKYGINLRASGREISVRFNERLPLGKYGRVRKADPTTIEIGRTALASEEHLATTIAHELRHARAYLGSGSNSERAARQSEAGLRGYIQGRR